MGNVGRDPEVKSFSNGGRIANLTLATSESWKDKATGERKERTEWHTVSIQNDGLVGIVERYVKNGSRLYLEGELRTRKWADKDGNDRYSTEVVLVGMQSTLKLLGDAKDWEKRGSQESQQPSGPLTDTSNVSHQTADLDDEIPF
ncbi:single-stranded DNA-binding protein [uncultured Caudovirales phage]|uniref:Single-stranded DNA-binding protein n=1 Tax=uncultured Caudovirales phage TaxID=2100421 RepID=A0A6J5KJI2_9CAUD|nr:single-stranded DNA-binding protein [uncultured Caudovirales phage]